MLFQSTILFSAVALALSAPLSYVKRADPCFVTGSVALAAEVAAGLPALEKVVTCNIAVEVAPGVPDIISGGVAYSTIDFQKSTSSPLGFSLFSMLTTVTHSTKFATPAKPATADLALLQNQLNTYLALEAGVRSQPNSSTLLGRLKGPKFFLQFQIARVQQAQGVKLSEAGTVEHQLEKVTKNAVGASTAEIAQVTALSKQF